MNKIALLPLEISRKIAAGEVIERPFSVVKELVENSIDAGATDIRIELLEGGKRLIRVQDNGAGMSRDDALICFERHSTSKIHSEEELDEIRTLGFRGEALASIGAVAQVTLRTSDGGTGQGVEIERRGGEPGRVAEIAFTRGTRIDVEDLFFNMPARKKFLRSDQSELGLIVKYATTVALAYPQIRFSLVHGKRNIIDCPAVESHRERIYQLYGNSMLDRLAEVDYTEERCRVRGFASRPLAGRGDKNHQVFFVNQRPVKDRVLQSALNQVYRGFLEKDMSPEAFLFLDLPYGDVDVNVHPSKTEVRFKDSPFVFHLILKAIGDLVLGTRTIKEIYPTPEAGKAGRVAERDTALELPLGEPVEVLPGIDLGEGVPLKPETGAVIPSGTAGAKERTRIYGQYLDMYILVAREDAILIVDQHNAHERVLYEKYREIGRTKSWPRRMPLIPVLLELSPSQGVSLEENAPVLEETGFRAEAMGGRSYALREFPDIFGDREAGTVFLSLLEEMKEGGVDAKRERMLATMACKTAVKAGEILSIEKMAYLVEELFTTSNPSLCPHGRPVIVRISRSQIDKGLRRHLSHKGTFPKGTPLNPVV